MSTRIGPRVAGIAFVPLAFLFGTARAQVVVVDPGGGGDYDDLQTALDAAPAGSTVMVRGTWENYRVFVGKGLTIVGMELRTTFGGISSSVADEALVEVDAGAADVTFDRLQLVLEPTLTPEGMRGLHVNGAGNVVLLDSTVECSTTMATSCESYDHDGDAIVVDAAASLAIVRSSIAGGSGWIVWSGGALGCDYLYDPRPRGGHAVRVTGTLGLLLAEESVLRGGDGCEVGFDGSDGSPPLAAPRGGDGGNAVDHPLGTLWRSGGQLLPGAGGRGWTYAIDPPLEDYGTDGVASTGPEIALARHLDVDPGDLGCDLRVAGHGFLPDRVALLFLSNELGGPMRARQGPWFLAWPFAFLGAVPTDATGAFLLHGELPGEPQWSGLTLIFQATDLATMSEPALIVIRPLS